MKYLFTIIISLFAVFAIAQQAVELGKVEWLRDIEVAQKQSKTTQKPIFLLFQEVPGCATCQKYGKQVLSHPLIVEAIEDEFVPLAIYNNKKGKDREVLDYFGEPSWNNPVVRIVDHQRNNLMPRLGGNYTALGVVQSMLFVLDNPPKYLQLLEKELLAEATGTETATLSMYCFWSGELNIGAIEGVVATEPGFMNGREVVQVSYNPAAVSYENILKKARLARCADRAYTDDAAQKEKAQSVLGEAKVQSEGTFKLDKDRKYYLSKSPYRFVPMTPLQAIKANKAVADKKSLTDILSPRQIALAKHIQSSADKKWKNQIGEDFLNAWESVTASIKE